MFVNRCELGALLGGIADTLDHTVLPGVEGDKARQQCRLAVTLLRRLAAIEPDRAALLDEEAADAATAMSCSPDMLRWFARRSLDRRIGLIDLPDSIGGFARVDPAMQESYDV